jgi:ABC-2 type transport system ATP-binding protein
MNNTTVISVQNLTKFYGKTTGVKNISFDVEEGEIFGFLGPNGAGKTTTIRLLLDLLRPDSGTISIFGKDLKTNSVSIRQQIGYLPGEFSTYSHLSGKDFLGFLSGIRRQKSHDLMDLLDRFKLTTSILDRKTRQYSHGMLQKLGIIQAVLHKPRLLIFDEPTAGLDPLMQEEFYQLVEEHQKRGATIFFSSHHLYEVEKLCQRVAIIRDGEIAGLESIASLKAKAGNMLEIRLGESFEKLEIPGAELVKQMGNSFIFKISGKLQPVLQKLANLPVEDVVISKPDLENVFMNFYRREKDE